MSKQSPFSTARQVGDVVYGCFDNFMEPCCPVTGFITKEVPPK